MCCSLQEFSLWLEKEKLCTGRTRELDTLVSSRRQGSRGGNSCKHKRLRTDRAAGVTTGQDEKSSRRRILIGCAGGRARQLRGPAPRPAHPAREARQSQLQVQSRVKDQMLVLSRISSARPRRFAALSSGTGETFYPVFGLTGAGSSRLFGHWPPVRTV
jgi:hypothetical protein